METLDNLSSGKTYGAPLLAGAVAGLTACTTLYPLDTLKTRLQSQQGFYKSGGFKDVYRGLLTVATGSMPGTAMFFVSYETTKSLLTPLVTPQYAVLVHMLAASISEVICCSINVPIEIAKQRKQTYTGTEKKSTIRILVDAYRSEGLRRGVYRGFLSTVARDTPFSFIEIPLWEALKTAVGERNGGNVTGLQSATCGAIAGGVAGALTTPLDLVKTRIMLAEATVPGQLRFGTALASVYLQTGFRGLFAGVAPRAASIMLGGFVFFGVYDHCKTFLVEHFDRKRGNGI